MTGRPAHRTEMLLMRSILHDNAAHPMVQKEMKHDG